MNTNAIPRPEYPRPDFERKEWLNLNGMWDFEFDDKDMGENEKWYEDKPFSKTITVPFCYQSKLSGIGSDEMHEIMWYKRSFTIPDEFFGKRLLLNFGAVDYYAKVWINGKYAGCHKGGHTPFVFDITNLVYKGENKVAVRVEDRYDCSQPRGKQYWKQNPEFIWYTPTSGIWQTVWIEGVPDLYIERMRMTPDIDKGTLLLEAFLNKACQNASLEIKVSYKDRVIKEIHTLISGRYNKITINIAEEGNMEGVHLWSPESPNLYNISLSLKQEGCCDEVLSFFGMRKIAVEGDRILLNNREYYQKLVLDQGYWEESLLTPPSDEAIKFDIEMTKKLGFNGARKHQKIEDPRYYYWADKLGLLVWGELPSAYTFNPLETERLSHEMMEFINRDYNHPSIVTWVPLNESWGVDNIYSDKMQQDFARSLYYLIKSLDSTRLISTNDGWELVEADICGIHDYTSDLMDFDKKYSDFENLMVGSANHSRMLFSKGVSYKNQPVLITEYGGIAIEEKDSNGWGYNGKVKDENAFLKRYSDITEAIKKIPYIRGYCYTQLTDVMQEVNGLLTAARKPKIDVDKIREINDKFNFKLIDVL